jgi:hypothetical protein
MTRQPDPAYFAEREASERLAARAAKSPAEETVHLEMARRYAVMTLQAEEARLAAFRKER